MTGTLGRGDPNLDVNVSGIGQLCVAAFSYTTGKMTSCKPRVLVALLTLTASIGVAEPLTQGERDRALAELYSSRKVFLDSIGGLSEAQWNFKPDANSWSIGECAEHIAVTEDTIFDLIANKMMKAPAPPDLRAKTQGKDEAVLSAVANRSQKFKAPEQLVPTHRWSSEEELVQHFKQSRDRLLDYVRTTNDDLRSHGMPHPAAGPLDAYQWVLLISAHCQRHTAQLNEVKTNPAYPKR